MKEVKKYALVSWKTVKLPRIEGGLQIRDLKLQNLATGAKLLWNLLKSRPSWCSRALKIKYFPGSRLRGLESDHVKKNGSPIFALCKKSLHKFVENLYWSPGNGKQINIWKDSVLGKPPPRLPHLQNWMETRDLTTLWSISEWDVNYPHRWLSWALPICPEELENDKLKLISHLAGNAPISKLSKDSRGWGQRNGIYTTAEGYKVYAENYNVPANPRIWKHNWNNKTLPKIDVFTWTLIHQRLLTGENMERRGIAGPFRCPLCAAN